MRDQAPGGVPFLPLAQLTLLLRRARGFRGTKALIETGTLMGSVVVRPAGKGRAFVGVLRTAKSSSGKDLFNIARIQEMGGVVVIRQTARMHRWLMRALRRARLGVKIQGRSVRGKYEKSKWQPSARSGGGASGVIIIRIPARPYIRPVIIRILSNPRALRERLIRRIARRLDFPVQKP
jgi:hypothetical protein